MIFISKGMENISIFSIEGVDAREICNAQLGDALFAPCSVCDKWKEDFHQWTIYFTDMWKTTSSTAIQTTSLKPTSMRCLTK